jgi:hypothetical protein
MLEAVVAILGSGLLGIGAWAVHLQSRVSVLEANQESVLEVINSKFDLMNSKLADLTRRLERIENKIDAR